MPLSLSTLCDRFRPIFILCPLPLCLSELQIQISKGRKVRERNSRTYSNNSHFSFPTSLLFSIFLYCQLCQLVLCHYPISPLHFSHLHHSHPSRTPQEPRRSRRTPVAFPYTSQELLKCLLNKL